MNVDEGRIVKPFKKRYVYDEIRQEGVSGELLFGKDTTTQRSIVIKRPNLLQPPIKRLKQEEDIRNEGKALQLLTDNGVSDICRLLELSENENEFDGTYYVYIVTEFAEGESLSSIVAKYLGVGQNLPWYRIFSMVERYAGVLAKAHELGLVYNDSKMDHLFWHEPSQSFKLIDWGNVYFYKEESEKGEPRIGPIDDIRQVGEMLMQIATGLRPVDTRYRMRDLTDADFSSSDAPIELRDIIQRALKAGATGGYISILTLQNDLHTLSTALASKMQQEFERARAATEADLPIFDLYTLLQKINLWSLEGVDPTDLSELQHSIQQKILEREIDAEWRLVKDDILDGEWNSALRGLVNLQNKSDSHPEIFKNVNSEHWGLLLQLLTWLGEPKTPEWLPSATQFVASEEPYKAIDAILMSQAPLKPLAVEAIHVITQNYGIPTVRMELEWLLKTLHAIELKSQDAETLDELKRAWLELNDLRKAFDHAPLSVGPLIEIYTRVNEKSTQLASVKPQSWQPEISQALARLGDASRNVARSLTLAQQTLVNKQFNLAAKHLGDARKLDVGGLQLVGLVSEIEVANRIIKNMSSTAERVTSLSEFDSWLKQLPRLLQEIQPQDKTILSIQDISRTCINQWEEFGRLHTAGKQLEALEAIRSLKRNIAALFPSAAAYLEKLEAKVQEQRPWEVDYRPDFSDAMSSALAAWRSDKPELAYEYLGKADKIASEMALHTNRPYKVWADWLKAIIECTNCLRRDDEEKYISNYLREANRRYASRETRFLEDWLNAIQSLRSGKYVDSISQAKNVIASYPEFTSYHLQLDAISQQAMMTASLTSAIEHVRQHNLTRANALLQTLNSTGTSNSALSDIFLALKASFDSFLSWQRGQFKQAEQQLIRARDLAKSSRVLSEATNEWLEVAGKSLKLLNDACEQALNRGPRETSTWESMAKVLATVSESLRRLYIKWGWSTDHIGVEYSLQTLRDLQYAFARNPSAFSQRVGQILNSEQNAPVVFLEVYRQWANEFPQKTADAQQGGKPVSPWDGGTSSRRNQSSQFTPRHPKTIIIIILLVLLVVIFLNNANIPSREPDPPTPKGSPTEMAVRPILTLTPSQTDFLTMKCEDIQKAVSRGDMRSVLQLVAEAKQELGSSFPVVYDSIRASCTLESYVTQAGASLGFERYSVQDFKQAQQISMQTTDLLRSFTMSSLINSNWRPPWEIDLLTQCARYQLNLQTRPSEALTALNELEEYWGGRVGFYSDIASRCKIDFDKAKTQLKDNVVPPSPSPQPTATIEVSITYSLLNSPNNDLWEPSSNFRFQENPAIADGGYVIPSIPGQSETTYYLDNTKFRSAFAKRVVGLKIIGTSLNDAGSFGIQLKNERETVRVGLQLVEGRYVVVFQPGNVILWQSAELTESGTSDFYLEATYQAGEKIHVIVGPNGNLHVFDNPVVDGQWRVGLYISDRNMIQVKRLDAILVQ